MQADAEHQQNHAQFRQLRGQFGIRNKTWRKRSRQHACQQIADKRRNTQLIGNHAENKSEHKSTNNGGDKRCGVVHSVSFRGECSIFGVNTKKPGNSL